PWAQSSALRRALRSVGLRTVFLPGAAFFMRRVYPYGGVSSCRGTAWAAFDSAARPSHTAAYGHCGGPQATPPGRRRCRSPDMSAVVPFLLLILTGAFAAYHRLRLATWVAIAVAALVAGWLLGASTTATAIAAVLLALVTVPLLVAPLRKALITSPLLKFFRKVLPPLSQTERIALETGSVGFEGELFTGDPDWDTLLSYPKPELTEEEQAFLDGPVEELCRMA